MERLTTNKSVSDMGMFELAHNCCYIAEDGNGRYRDYEMDIDERDFTRKLMSALVGEELPLGEESFDEEMMDNLMIDPFEDVQGLIALLYRNMWAMADLREKLKRYEDAEERLADMFGGVGMDRLTERTAIGVLVKEDYGEKALKTLYSCNGGKPNPHYTNCDEGYCAMEKLAAYEDAEEQGRLLRLPCKVGDALYQVNKDAKEPVIAMRALQVYVKQLHKDRTVIRIDAINDNDMDESCYFLEDIGEKVFFTREEAEAKLKEMEGNND